MRYNLHAGSGNTSQEDGACERDTASSATDGMLTASNCTVRSRMTESDSNGCGGLDEQTLCRGLPFAC